MLRVYALQYNDKNELYEPLVNINISMYFGYESLFS